MTDVARAEEFLRLYGADYKDILDKVLSESRALEKSLGVDVISDVYSRGSSQGGDEFKDTRKIAGKIRQRGWPVSAQSFLKLNDIIGITVVVQYPDQLNSVIASIKKALKRAGLKIGDLELHMNKNGYFASHLVCYGERQGEKLNCEIQFKTMLHDAWSAKMHNLTYKSLGLMDPRLGALMASIAVTIQSLEEQSQLIREIIKANWNVEGEARLAARQFFFDSMLHYGADVWTANEDHVLTKLHDDIEKSRGVINSQSQTHCTIRRLIGSIDKCCGDENRLRQAWIMAGRLADLRQLEPARSVQGIDMIAGDGHLALKCSATSRAISVDFVRA